MIKGWVDDLTHGSQKVKLLVQRFDLADSCFNGLLLPPFPVRPFLVVASSLRVPDGHVEVRNFMCILARSWNLDRSRPVEIAVTKSECQLLDFNFLERTLVEGNEAVCR